MNPILKWPGGKFYLRKHILPLIPAHDIYCELFAGGLSILLSKSESLIEVANDIDVDVINFYKQVTENYYGFFEILDHYNYCEQDYQSCQDYEELEMGTERAVQFFIRNRMSTNGRFSWSNRMRNGLPEMVSRWITILASVESVAKRLRHIRFRSQHFRDVFPNNPDTFVYCDPPYLPETRSSKELYRCEMSYEEHEEFLDLANNSKSKVMINHYPCRLYNKALAHWQYIPITDFNHGNVTSEKRTEGLWLKTWVHS